MESIFPPKLHRGDTVEIVAPAHSLATIGKEEQTIAAEWFTKLGLNLVFAKHVMEIDAFDSSSIESRVEDLMGAFQNPKAKAIVCVTGGFNSNQLLRYIDWDVIRNNPKIFMGFSDITALGNAIFAKTGLVTYSGPTYSTFTQKLFIDYAVEYVQRCLMSDEPFDIVASDTWSDDDEVAENQMDRHQEKNPGWLVIHEGVAQGRIIGGNQCTLNLLQGTEYMPPLKDSILFLEDDYEAQAHHFDRDLQSLIHLPEFSGVQGVVIGRFQRASHTSTEKLLQMIHTKKELDHLPVIANVDFGHTNPKITFPIGGMCSLRVSQDNSAIQVHTH